MGLRGSWAAQVVLCGFAAILQSCGTSCPGVGVNTVGRVSPHLVGGGQLRLQGAYCKPALRGGGEARIHRSRSGIETEAEDEAGSRPRRTPSVLREGSSQCMPNGNPPRRIEQQLGGVIDTPSNRPHSNGANGTTLDSQPPPSPEQTPGGAQLDCQPAAAPPSNGRHWAGATIVKTLAQLTWFYDIELNENGVRAITSFWGDRFW